MLQFNQQTLVSNLDDLIIKRFGDGQQGPIILENFRHISAMCSDIAKYLQKIFCIPQQIYKNKIIWQGCSDEAWSEIKENETIDMGAVIDLAERFLSFRRDGLQCFIQDYPNYTGMLYDIRESLTLYSNKSAFCRVQNKDGKISLKIMHHSIQKNTESNNNSTVMAWEDLLQHTTCMGSMAKRKQIILDKIKKGHYENRLDNLLEDIGQLQHRQQVKKENFAHSFAMFGIFLVLLIASFLAFQQFPKLLEYISSLQHGEVILGDPHLLAHQESLVEISSENVQQAIQDGVLQVYQRIAEIDCKALGLTDPKQIEEKARELYIQDLQYHKSSLELVILTSYQKQLRRVIDPFEKNNPQENKNVEKNNPQENKNVGIFREKSGTWQFAFHIKQGKYVLKIQNSRLSQTNSKT